MKTGDIMNFDKLLSLKQNDKIEINGNVFDVLSKTTYMTLDSTDEYVKYILSGHKVLVVIPADELVYLGEIASDFEKGKTFSKSLEHNGKIFTQIASDYQVVKLVEFGDPREVEGEVLWADYTCDDDEHTYISCAYVPKTDSRADIVGIVIDAKNINIL